MCKFQKNEDKANAHAGMPLCGVSRFAVPAFKSVFGCMTKEQQPFWGVGRLCLSFLGMHSLTWINATICAFLYSYKIGSVHCSLTGADSIGVNDGGCYGFE